MPDLQVGSVVTVRGIGLRFDANYAVMKIVHEISRDGYLSHLSLLANSSSMLANGVPAAGEVNEKPTGVTNTVAVTPTNLDFNPTDTATAVTNSVFVNNPIFAFR